MDMARLGVLKEVASAGSVFLVATVANGQPSFQAIGGSNRPEAHAVSADGRFAAGHFDFGLARAFRWSSATGAQDLGATLPWTTTLARGISADGSVVVGHGYTYGSGGGQRPFRWTEATGIQMLAIPAGISDAYAHATSADGSTTVGQGPFTGPSALRWDSNGAVEVLPPLSPNGTAVARAVSGDGSRIVGASDGRAVFWDSDGVCHDVGILPGMIDSGFTGSSWDGSVLVGNATTPTYRTVPFYWTAASEMVPLPILGSLSGHVYGVSADGRFFVGENYSNRAEAVIWTPDRQPHWLDDFMTGLGVNVSNWRLYQASAISADGTTIVGRGTDGDDHWGYVAVIPSPGVGTVALGVLLFIRRRSRSTGRTG